MEHHLETCPGAVVFGLPLKSTARSRLIGSAGSFETVASMIRHRNSAAGSHYGKSSHPISLRDLNALYRDLIKSTTAERRKMKGLISMRVDMIVPASVLLNFVLKKSAISNIILSSYSLKEGAIEHILEGNKFS
jgi:exopolyphosphatase / guanosine-5'-triphosphate,3'-diphosphate pyrophosphatase